MQTVVEALFGPAGVPWPRRLAAVPVRLYRLTLSHFLGGHCRFRPTCSLYALEAIERHGVIKGWALALWRLLRCQPCCRGGYDPPPPVREKTAAPNGSPEGESGKSDAERPN